jgi:hypothetical protein
MTSEEIDKALAKNLDKEGLIRLKAVELTIEFFKNFQVTDLKHFNKQFEDTYNFLTNKPKE